MSKYDWILYPGSPFYTTPGENSVKNVQELIGIRKTNLGLAIAIETALTGTTIHELHEKDFDKLEFEFEAKPVQLNHYLYGFTTPPALIMGGHLSLNLTLKEVIKMICLASKDNVLRDLNAYKATHLVAASEIYQSSYQRDALTPALQIYELCRRIPFGQSEYFIIGLEASEYFYLELLNHF